MIFLFFFFLNRNIILFISILISIIYNFIFIINIINFVVPTSKLILLFIIDIIFNFILYLWFTINNPFSFSNSLYKNFRVYIDKLAKIKYEEMHNKMHEEMHNKMHEEMHNKMHSDAFNDWFKKNNK